MKSIRIFILSALSAALISQSCEEVIYPELADSEPVVSIDAFLTDKDEAQIIRVQKTGYYFNTEVPAVSGAEVRVINEGGEVFVFEEGTTPGSYEWNPASGTQKLGEVGTTYSLSVFVEGIEYTATSTTGRVPEIDSLTFFFEPEDQFSYDSWYAELWARDLEGPGDAYWIKGWKNGKYLNKPDEILIAFDAGFSRGSQIDGLIFIPPIRRGTGINPSFELDEDTGKTLPAYVDGDSLYVEIHSITHETFDFLTNVAIQINRPGGFGELFAQPLANVPTNIEASEECRKVVGFFNVSSVKSIGKKLVAEEENLE